MEVRRTRAGDAELATPSHGLSLAQRRILTLLDTPATLADLAKRHALEPARVDRDAARLRLAGLIEDAAPAVAAIAATAPVRLGAPLARRLPLALVPIVAGALAWAGWQHLAAPGGTDSPRPRRAAAVSAAEGKVTTSTAPEPVPIATRVLRGSVSERPHETGKEARAPARPADAATPPVGETAAARKAAAQPPEMARVTATPASPAAPALQAPAVYAPLPASRPEARPASDAKSVSDAKPVPQPEPAPQAETHPEPARATSPADTHTSPPAEPAPAPDARLSPMPPLQTASIAPVAASLRAPVPAPKLTPIVRETPAFPREAIAQGLASGNVKARITVDARGRVASVDILETSHRAFERTVRETLAGWQFEAGAGGRTTTVDVAFRRD